VPERNLHDTFEQLVSLGYVSRRYPVTGTKPRRIDVRFVLDDALLRFWFRFVFPQRSQLAQLDAHRAWERLVAPQLESWAGSGFERLCREALPMMLEKEGVRTGVEVGAFWSKEVEIDLVGVRDDGVTELGECKWGPVTAAQLVAELKEKAERCPTRSLMRKRCNSRRDRIQRALEQTGVLSILRVHFYVAQGAGDYRGRVRDEDGRL
jgi:uncharacterized protein